MVGFLDACWFITGDCPCTTFCCSELLECIDIPVDVCGACCFGDSCAHGMELAGDEPVPWELSTISSSVLADPHVSGLDAGDGAAGWMGLNDVPDLWGAMPDVVGIGDWSKGYIPGHCMCLSKMSTSVATLETASCMSNSSGNFAISSWAVRGSICGRSSVHLK